MHKRLLLILFCCSALHAGGLLRVPYEGVRPTGMGNAFIAIADDQNALFYNPAALAWNQGVHFNLFDFLVGVDSAATLTQMWNALKSGNTNNLLRSDTQFMRLQYRTTLTAPYFGFSLYNNFQGFFDLTNLEVAEADVYAFNELGLMLGFGLPIGKHFSVGATLKALQRSAVDAQITPQSLIENFGITTTDFEAAAFSYLQRQMGTGYGYGVDLGGMLKFPIEGKRFPEVRLGATIENVSDLNFRSFGGGVTPPPSLPMTFNFGSALTYEAGKKGTITLAADMRRNFESLPMFKQFHFGVEYRNPFVSARVGLYQGWPTFGFSIEQPPHTRIHFSTYAAELGDSLWQRSYRFYLMQVVIGFNPV